MHKHVQRILNSCYILSGTCQLQFHRQVHTFIRMGCTLLCVFTNFPVSSTNRKTINLNNNFRQYSFCLENEGKICRSICDNLDIIIIIKYTTLVLALALTLHMSV